MKIAKSQDHIVYELLNYHLIASLLGEEQVVAVLITNPAEPTLYTFIHLN